MKPLKSGRDETYFRLLHRNRSGGAFALPALQLVLPLPEQHKKTRTIYNHRLRNDFGAGGQRHIQVNQWPRKWGAGWP